MGFSYSLDLLLGQRGGAEGDGGAGGAEDAGWGGVGEADAAGWEWVGEGGGGVVADPGGAVAAEEPLDPEVELDDGNGNDPGHKES